VSCEDFYELKYDDRRIDMDTQDFVQSLLFSTTAYYRFQQMHEHLLERSTDDCT